MSASKSTCPRCGGSMTSSGFDSHVNHGAAHIGMHGLKHGHPAFMVIGAGMALARALFPKKSTCRACGYTIRD